MAPALTCPLIKSSIRAYLLSDSASPGGGPNPAACGEVAIGTQAAMTTSNAVLLAIDAASSLIIRRALQFGAELMALARANPAGARHAWPAANDKAPP